MYSEMTSKLKPKDRRYQAMPSPKSSKITFNWPEQKGKNAGGDGDSPWKKDSDRRHSSRVKYDYTVPTAVHRLAKFRQGYYTYFHRCGILELGSDTTDEIDMAFLQALQPEGSHHDEILHETNHLRCSNSDGLRIRQDGTSSHQTMNIQLKADNDELRIKNQQLMHELERLKADGASERQCRLQSESAPAPAAKSSPASVCVDMAALLKIFDAVDQHETGFATRLDLKQRIDDLVGEDSFLQRLSDTIGEMEAMIMERDEFEDIVEHWLTERLTDVSASLVQSSIGFD